MDEPLFREGDLRNALEGHARGMEEEIAKAPEDHLMRVVEDEWIAALVERYTIHVPELQRGDWWMDQPQEIQVDVGYEGQMRAILDFSQPALVSGVRVVVHVPFVGEADIFKFTPSTRNYNPPRATIRGAELRLVIEYPADSPRDVKAEAEGVLNNIDSYLSWTCNDADTFNRTLEQRARGAIQARKNRVLETYRRLESTGIPYEEVRGCG